jgi:hypothetical protein
MGQQQIIIVVLTTILVGIAIAVGILLFQAGKIQSNKDALTEGLMTIEANARAYYERPRSLGGGSKSYENYLIPSRLTVNENGTFTLDGTPLSTTLKFKAISSDDPGDYIKATLDISTQRLKITEYGGDFDDGE